jgi:carbamoyltransferase
MISLGINYSQMHDSSACIARDGEVLFAVAEERLSRVKHDARFPALAIQACLDFAGVGTAGIDFICQGWSPPRAPFLHDLKNYVTGRQPADFYAVLNSTRFFLSMWHQRGGESRFRQSFADCRAKFRFVDHHLAHAISAYAYSGFEDTAILVLDGRGAWEATSLWHGRNGHLKHVWTIPWPNSLGLFYAKFTHYLGFTPYSDEWKVMGLAPYGGPGVDLTEYIRPNESPYWVATKLLMGKDSAPLAHIEKRMGPGRVPESELDTRHKNIAWAVQDMCEQAMMTLAKTAVAQTGSHNLCLAGGVALNSKANGKIRASGIVDRIFVQPAASDDGVCLGAVLAPYLDKGGKLPVRKMRHAYLGNECSDAEIEKALQTYKIRATRVPDPAVVAAEKLWAGCRAAWNSGHGPWAAVQFSQTRAIPI